MRFSGLEKDNLEHVVPLRKRTIALVSGPNGRLVRLLEEADIGVEFVFGIFSFDVEGDFDLVLDRFKPLIKKSFIGRIFRSGCSSLGVSLADRFDLFGISRGDLVSKFILQVRITFKKQQRLVDALLEFVRQGVCLRFSGTLA